MVGWDAFLAATHRPSLSNKENLKFVEEQGR